MIRTVQHCRVHFCPNFKIPGKSYCKDHLGEAPAPELPWAHVTGPLFAAGIVNGVGTWSLALERVKQMPKHEAVALWEAMAAGAEALGSIIDASDVEAEIKAEVGE